MRVAVVYFGLLRDENYVSGTFHRMNSLLLKAFGDNDVAVKYYYSCPLKKNEFDDENMDEILIQERFRQEYGAYIDLHFRQYDVMEFIREADNLKLPILNSSKWYSYRLISLVHAIQSSARLVDTENVDLIVFTRLDLVNEISSIGVLDRQNYFRTAYLYRTCPYRTNDHAEDRIFYGGSKAMSRLKDYYKWMGRHGYKKESHEELLLDFFRNMKDIDIRHQDDSLINTKIYTPKYSEEFYKKVVLLYDMLSSEGHANS